MDIRVTTPSQVAATGRDFSLSATWTPGVAFQATEGLVEVSFSFPPQGLQPNTAWAGEEITESTSEPVSSQLYRNPNALAQKSFTRVAEVSERQAIVMPPRSALAVPAATGTYNIVGSGTAHVELDHTGEFVIEFPAFGHRVTGSYSTGPIRLGDPGATGIAVLALLRVGYNQVFAVPQITHPDFGPLNQIEPAPFDPAFQDAILDVSYGQYVSSGVNASMKITFRDALIGAFENDDTTTDIAWILFLATNGDDVGSGNEGTSVGGDTIVVNMNDPAAAVISFVATIPNVRPTFAAPWDRNTHYVHGWTRHIPDPNAP